MANFNVIIERINQTVPELTNNSVASIWQRIVAVFSTVIDIVQLEFGRTKDIIEYSARNLRVMGKQYYIDTAFAFQDGDSVVVVDPETLREGYAVIDANKQIIKQVAVSTPSSGQVLIKVATADNNGTLIPLTTEQLASFRSYMDHFSPVGIEVTTMSAQPDIFECGRLYIRYNPESSLTKIQQDLYELLIRFQSTFNPDVPLYINDVETAIRGVSGIRDAWFDSANAVYFNGTTPVHVYPVNGVLNLNAGYFNFDPSIYNWSDGLTVFEQA